MWRGLSALPAIDIDLSIDLYTAGIDDTIAEATSPLYSTAL